MAPVAEHHGLVTDIHNSLVHTVPISPPPRTSAAHVEPGAAAAAPRVATTPPVAKASGFERLAAGCEPTLPPPALLPAGWGPSVAARVRMAPVVGIAAGVCCQPGASAAASSRPPGVMVHQLHQSRNGTSGGDGCLMPVRQMRRCSCRTCAPAEVSGPRRCTRAELQLHLS
jgi:hypothetical protein